MFLSDWCLNCLDRSDKRLEVSLKINKKSGPVKNSIYACSLQCETELKNIISRYFNKSRCINQCNCDHKYYIFCKFKDNTVGYVQFSKNENFFGCYNYAKLIRKFLIDFEYVKLCYIGDNKPSLPAMLNSDLSNDNMININKVKHKYKVISSDITMIKSYVNENEAYIKKIQQDNEKLNRDIDDLKSELLNIKNLIHDFMNMFKNCNEPTLSPSVSIK